MGKAGQGRSRRQRRAARATPGPAVPRGGASAEAGPAPLRAADRRATIGARFGFGAFAAAAILLPVVAPREPGQPLSDGWASASGACTCLFLLLAAFYVVLPLNLTAPRVSSGPVLTVVTVRGPRFVRLDALTQVRALEPASRGTPSLFVGLRDADGGRVVASFKSSRPLPAALRHAVAALAQRDPAAVSSRARHYFDLPGRPTLARRLAQGTVSMAVGMCLIVTALALSMGWVALLQ